MHIEPGIVAGAKMTLSYATGGIAVFASVKLLIDTLKTEKNGLGLLSRILVATALVSCFFEILPTFSAGVSEVHFIFGPMLLLLFGTGPAVIGLACGLLLQGLFFAPFDLPQYGMNVTTLIMPLLAVHVLSGRLIPSGTRFVDLGYSHVLTLSLLYQGGIVGWVAFWAFYGQGLSLENTASVFSFAAPYFTVVLIEPFVDLVVLACVKSFRHSLPVPLFNSRLTSSLDS